MEPRLPPLSVQAGYLHDIGKVAVDKRLFGKPTSLDAEEFARWRTHTVVGHQIVSGVEFPGRAFLKSSAPIMSAATGRDIRTGW